MAIPKLLKETRYQLHLTNDDNRFWANAIAYTDDDGNERYGFEVGHADGGNTLYTDGGFNVDLPGLHTTYNIFGLTTTTDNNSISGMMNITQGVGLSIATDDLSANSGIIFGLPIEEGAPAKMMLAHQIGADSTPLFLSLDGPNQIALVNSNGEDNNGAVLSPYLVGLASAESESAGGFVQTDEGIGIALDDYVIQKSPMANGLMVGNSSDDPVVLSNIADPVFNNDAVNKGYVENLIANAGGTFYAIYQETTYQEVVNAYNAGKGIVCLVGSTLYSLYYIPDTTETSDELYFYAPYSYNQMGEKVRYVILYNDNTWKGIYVSTLNNFTVAKYYNGATTISASRGYYRPIRASIEEPTADEGNVGDIWVVYSNA